MPGFAEWRFVRLHARDDAVCLGAHRAASALSMRPAVIRAANSSSSFQRQRRSAAMSSIRSIVCRLRPRPAERPLELTYQPAPAVIPADPDGVPVAGPHEHQRRDIPGEVGEDQSGRASDSTKRSALVGARGRVGGVVAVFQRVPRGHQGQGIRDRRPPSSGAPTRGGLARLLAGRRSIRSASGLSRSPCSTPTTRGQQRRHGPNAPALPTAGRGGARARGGRRRLLLRLS